MSYRRWFTKTVPTCNRRLGRRAGRSYRTRLEGLEDRWMPATVVWSGLGTDDLWTTGANWVGGKAPSPGDDLIFPETATKRSTTDDLTQNTFGAIDILAAGYTIDYTPETPPLTIGSRIRAIFSGKGDSVINLPITLGEDVSLTASESGATLILSGPLDLAGKTLTLDGSGGVKFLNGGGIEDSSQGHAGEILKSGEGTWSLSGPSSYAGTTTVTSGTVAVGAGDALGTGTLVVKTGNEAGARALLQNTTNGSVDLHNAVTLEGGELDLLGDFSFHGDIKLEDDTTLMPGRHDIITLSGTVHGSPKDPITEPSLIISGDYKSYVNIQGMIDASVSVVVENQSSGGESSVGISGTLDGSILVNGPSATLQLGNILTGSGAIRLKNGELVSRGSVPNFSGSILLNGGSVLAAASQALGTGPLEVQGTGPSPVLLQNNQVGVTTTVQLMNEVTLSSGKLAVLGPFAFEKDVTVTGKSTLVPEDPQSNIHFEAVVHANSELVIDESAHANVNLFRGIDGNAVVRLKSNSSVNLQGAFENSISVEDQATLLLNGVTGTGTISLSGGTLESPESLPNFSGNVTLVSGTAQLGADNALGVGPLVTLPSLQGNVVKIVTPGGSQIRLDNAPLGLSGGTMEVQGKVLFTKPALISLPTIVNPSGQDSQVEFDGLVVSPGRLLTLQGPGSFVFGGGYRGDLNSTNAPDIQLTGGDITNLTLGRGARMKAKGNVRVKGQINDYGIISTPLDDPLDIAGLATIEPGGMLDDQGGVTVEEGGLLDIFGTLTNSGTLIDSGAIRVEAGATLSNPDAVSVQGNGVLITATTGNAEYPTITVNSVKDYRVPRGGEDNLLTLREAVELINGTLKYSNLTDAQKAQVTNGMPGEGPMDVIAFHIPGSDVDAMTGEAVSNVDPTSGAYTIHLGSPLPTINRTVDLDGYTQPGASPATEGSPAQLMIELDGSNAGSDVNGLVTENARGCITRGLIINRFGAQGDANGFALVLGVGGADSIVQGNYIGTDAKGEEALGNSAGIGILSPYNTIGGPRPEDRNVISGNAYDGIQIGGERRGFGGNWMRVNGVVGNVIQGNTIGLDASGQLPLGNGIGIGIWSGASDNLIGGPAVGDGNVVSGNLYDGVWIDTSSGDDNIVRGNVIGTDRTGAVALANGLGGIEVDGGADHAIGGLDPADGNVIAGNGGTGVLISGPGATDVTVQNNHIGTDASGAIGLGNALQGVDIENSPANLVLDNVISANGASGLVIQGIQASGNEVEGNRIGTDGTGHGSLANGQAGVTIVDAPSNVIGGQNVISGNETYGVYITGATATGNSVLDNLIGTTADGTAALPNLDDGVRIDGAAGNTIGGRNVISGNVRYGVAVGGQGATGNLIAGNLVGTDSSGLKPLGNQIGVSIDNVPSNTVGGSGVDARNIISGNNDAGIRITGQSARGDLVQGNWIGLGKDGSTKLGNAVDGVRIDQSASGILIGGATPSPGTGPGNIISDNLHGVAILGAATQNTVQGNLIGTDAGGQAAHGNQTGIWISAANGNTIGGNAQAGEGNVIASSRQDGVMVDAGTGNAIRQNSIHESTNRGIDLVNNGNNGQPAPVLTSLVTQGIVTIQGTLTAAAGATYTLDFFNSPAPNPSGFGEGQTLLGSTTVTTDDKGNAGFTVAFAASAPGQFVSATATDASGNTSAFSRSLSNKTVPSITSAASTKFTVGTSGSFTVTTEPGFPVPTVIKEDGPLPEGVLFKDKGDGTATLSGTPAVGSGAKYNLTFTAYNNNFTEQSEQQFTLIVSEAPTITSQDSATFTVGVAAISPVTTDGGYPTPIKLSEGLNVDLAYQIWPTLGISQDKIQDLLKQTLPQGLDFKGHDDNAEIPEGTAWIIGTPARGTGGIYPLTITAANQDGTGSSSQVLLLTVLQAPSFDTENETTWTTNTAGTFTIKTEGFPKNAKLSEAGAPGWLGFKDNGDGTATLSGTPPAGSAGNYGFTITADNGGISNQTFTLTVVSAPTTWTVMYYCNGDNSLGPAVPFNLDQMDRVATTGTGVNMFALVDSLSWHDTREGRIGFGEPPLTSVGDQDMGDPNTLIQFVNWAEQQAPAAHYALIVYDHGSMDGVSLDEPSGKDFLTIPRLRMALAALPYFDVLQLDACLMQDVEVATELVGHVGYVEASQTTRLSELTKSGSFSHYDQGLDYLVAQPGATARSLASALFDADANQAASVLNLGQMPALDAALDAFAEAALSSATPADWTRLAAAGGFAKSFTYDNYRDLNDYMRAVAADQGISAVIRQAAEGVSALVAPVVIDQKGLGNGLSISLPNGGVQVAPQYNGNEYTFLDPSTPYGTHWRDFLLRLPAGRVQPPVSITVSGGQGMSLGDAIATGAAPGQGADVEGTLQTPADVHFFSLNASAGQVLYALGEGEHTGTLLPVLTVYARDGRTVLVQQVAADGDAVASITGLKLPQDGTYFLAVSSAGNLDPLHPIAGTSGGRYFLSATFGDPAQVAPQLHVSSTTVDFGALPVGVAGTAILRVTNAGQTTLTIRHLEVPDSSSYLAPAAPILLPIRLAPGAGIDLPISVVSAQPASLLGTLHIQSNDPNNPDVQVTLKAAAAVPPAIGAAFDPVAVPVDGTANLTFTITNPGANIAPLSRVAFTERLPAGLIAANGTTAVGGGTLTVSGGNTIRLDGASIPVGGQLEFGVPVMGLMAGNYTGVSGVVTSAERLIGNSATADLVVAAAPVVTESFGSPSITLDGTTSLTVTITNPNPSMALTGIAFTDTLPAGLILASPANVTNGCGGSITAEAGSRTISLSGGTLAAGGVGTMTVSVTATTTGSLTNWVSTTSAEGGTAEWAGATLVVVPPPPGIAHMLSDIGVALQDPEVQEMTVVGDTLYFTVFDGTGRELGMYDGSTFTEVRVGTACDPKTGDLTAVGSTLYFVAADSSGLLQLWQYGGSGSPTEVTAGPAFSAKYGAGPNHLTVLGSTLYYAAHDAGGKEQLWQYGGSGSPLEVTTGPAFDALTGANPYLLWPVGSTLYFAAYDASGFPQLWRYGGSGSPSLVTAGPAFSASGVGSIDRWSLAAVGSTVYFSAQDAHGHPQLWQYDGSGSPTRVTADSGFSSVGAYPGQLTAVGSTLYFIAYDASGGFELWQYGGSGSATLVTAGPSFSALSAHPDNLTVVGSTLYFTAYDANNPTNWQLWQYEGSGSPALLTDGPAFLRYGAAPTHLTVAGSTLYFKALDFSKQWQIWRFEGSGSPINVTAGTGIQVSLHPSDMFVMGSTLYFVDNDASGAANLWRYGGSDRPILVTAGPTFQSRGPGATDLTAVGSTLYFNSSDANSFSQLWRYSNDTPPQRVVLTTSRAPSSPMDFVAVGSAVYFSATDGLSGQELWRTDGTAAGTTQVADLWPGFIGSEPSNLTAVGSTLYFSAAPTPSSSDLWQYGGSGPPIDVTAGSGVQASAVPNDMVAVGSTLYFVAEDPGSGRNLWQYEGSGSPTLVTAGPAFGASGAYPNYLTAVGATLYFSAADAGGRDQLWQYGGSGTPIEVTTGPAFSAVYGAAPAELTAVGSTLYFTVNDANNHRQLWQYGGSGAPTQFTAFTGSYSAATVAAVGSTLYVSAVDPYGHSQLWQYGDDGIATLVAQNVGTNVECTAVGSTLYYTALDGGGHSQLWQYRGSGSPLEVTAGPAFSASGASPLHLTAVGSTLDFVATDAGGKLQLWKYDGTGSPTLIAINPTCGSNPTNLTAIGNTLYVSANDGMHGDEPWIIPSVGGPATSGPILGESFKEASIALGTNTTLTLTIDNPDPSKAFSGIAFTDTLPAGLVVAGTPNLTSTSGGTATAVAGSSTISLAGGSLSAGGHVAITVDVTGTLAGAQTNSVTLTSTEGGTGNTATASVNVEAPPTLSVSFNPGAIIVGGTTSLSFTITNPEGNPDALIGVALTDTLPAGLTVANSSAVVGGGILNMSGGNAISLAGASIPVGGRLRFSVPVTGALAGDDTDVTGAVTSSNGGTGHPASASLTVLPTNLPPMAPDLTVTTSENTPVAIDVAAGASDPDGDLDPATVRVIAPPAHGSVAVDPATGAATYTPEANYHGTDTFHYAMSDTGGLSASASVTITVQFVNQPPTAVDDTARTLRNTPVVINVLANDSDIEGDLDPTSLRVGPGPSHGSATVDPQTHLVTYTPMTGFVGMDPFSYTIGDTAGASASATVTVNVRDHPPQAHDVAATLSGIGPVTIDVTANVTDAGNDVIPGSVRIVKPPIEGTAIVDPATGKVTYNPGAKFTGIDMFIYSVSDSLGSSGGATVVLQGPSSRILPPVSGPTREGPPPGQSATSMIVTSDYPAGSTYGQNVTLTARVVATSGGAGTPTGTVQFQIDGFGHGSPVTLSGGAVQISLGTLPAGPHSIIAYYISDSSSFADSDNTSDGFTQIVNQAPLTVTADGLTRPYGAPDPAFTASFTGFVNGDRPSALAGTLVFRTTATSASHVGTYSITPGGLASANYKIAFIGSTLTVTPVPLTVAADNKSMRYGRTMPPLTASFTGLVNGDTPSTFSVGPNAPPILSTVPATSPAGSYTITIRGASDPDYSIIFVNGTLTIQNLTSPVVKSVERLGYHWQPTRLQVTFSEPLSRSSVQDIANYIVIAPGPDGRFGTRDDWSIPIRSARYDASTNTVTLSPAERLNVHWRYELVVKGSAATGVTDLAGNRLDGVGNGRPGSNYVVVLRGFGKDEPGHPFWKLIHDQLGGKPISSRRVNLWSTSRVSHQPLSSPSHATVQHSLRSERASVPHGPLPFLRTRRIR
jgi:ELWxxDGT repeat protein/autotransporter-associated beta strand protein